MDACGWTDRSTGLLQLLQQQPSAFWRQFHRYGGPISIHVTSSIPDMSENAHTRSSPSRCLNHSYRVTVAGCRIASSTAIGPSMHDWRPLVAASHCSRRRHGSLECSALVKHNMRPQHDGSYS